MQVIKVSQISKVLSRTVFPTEMLLSFSFSLSVSLNVSLPLYLISSLVPSWQYPDGRACADDVQNGHMTKVCGKRAL